MIQHVITQSQSSYINVTPTQTTGLGGTSLLGMILLGELIIAQDIWVAGHPEGVSVSTDGNGWSHTDRSAKGGFVAIGDGTISLVNPDGNINAGSHSSDGGATWSDTTCGLTATNTLTGLAGQNTEGNFMVGTYVDSGGASNGTIRSTDGGNSWGAGGTLPNADYWSDVTYGGGKFVAIAGTAANPSNNAAYSTDDVSVGHSNSIRAWSVTYGRDRFVAMTAKTDSSTAETAVSYDGITWYAGSIEPGEWTGIGYAQEHSVAQSDTDPTQMLLHLVETDIWRTKLLGAGFETPESSRCKNNKRMDCCNLWRI